MYIKKTTQYSSTILFIFLLVISFQISGCKEIKNEKNINEENIDVMYKEKHHLMDEGPMKDKAVKIAIKKAEELDYQINEMNIEVSKPGKIIYVYFSPKQQAMMGGDLTVLIDSESMVINDIIRGQ